MPEPDCAQYGFSMPFTLKVGGNIVSQYTVTAAGTCSFSGQFTPSGSGFTYGSMAVIPSMTDSGPVSATIYCGGYTGGGPG